MYVLYQLQPLANYLKAPAMYIKCYYTTGGNQRELARAKNQKKQKKEKSNSSKADVALVKRKEM